MQLTTDLYYISTINMDYYVPELRSKTILVHVFGEKVSEGFEGEQIIDYPGKYYFNVTIYQ